MEDLNYLYHRQQVSLMRAQEAGCSAVSASHRATARAYGHRIAAVRAGFGMRPATAV